MKEQLSQNLSVVNERIAKACDRAGRRASEITIVAVTKYLTASEVVFLPEVGLTTLGENRVQELQEKVRSLPSANWQMIGHLQRNKARKACELTSLIHSVDSERLVEAIDEAGQVLGRKIAILLEVNVSGEETKQGLAPSDVPAVLERAIGLANVEPRGLMTMAPLVENPEGTRKFFRELHELLDRMRDKYSLPGFTELSMGMSGDYTIAVEEGATLVRIGSALYEGIL